VTHDEPMLQQLDAFLLHYDLWQWKHSLSRFSTLFSTKIYKTKDSALVTWSGVIEVISLWEASRCRRVVAMRLRHPSGILLIWLCETSRISSWVSLNSVSGKNRSLLCEILITRSVDERLNMSWYISLISLWSSKSTWRLFALAKASESTYNEKYLRFQLSYFSCPFFLLQIFL
jgi:hypothetical protein